MSKKLLVAAVTVMVERDAMTTLPTTVAAHEVAILQAVFGDENVTGETDAGVTTIELTEEAERLEKRYGGDAVMKVYPTKAAVVKAVQEHSKGEVDDEGNPVKSAKAAAK